MKATLTETYFSSELKWIMVVFCLTVGLYLIFYTSYGWITTIFALMLAILFTTKGEVTVNLKNHQITDRFSSCGITIKTEKTSFQKLNGISINKKKHSYTANSRSRTRQVDFNEYIGTLKFDDAKTVELTRSINYDAFANDISHMASLLNLEVSRIY